MRLSRILVEIELSWGSDKLTLNDEEISFHRSGVMVKIYFRSTHAGEKHIFSMSPSIHAFNFI